MARFHPPRVRSDASYGERQVFDRLRQLNDSWIVLHSLHFAWQARNSVRLGESDFVLLHPRHGILVLEVKDARYRVEARTWYRQPKDGQEKVDRQSPFEQAEQNRHKITGLLRQAGMRRVPVGHCVLFTAGVPSGQLGPDAPSQIVLTLSTLDDAPAAIEQVSKHWSVGSWQCDADFTRALEVLSPEAQISPTLDYEVDVSLGELHRLTDRSVRLTTSQLDVIRSTSGNSAIVVLGAAGTGKTLIAYEYARQLAAQRKKVAVVGTPKQLRLLTRRVMAQQGVIVGDVFDLLCATYSAEERAPFEGQTAWEQAIELIDRHGAPLDALLVDEAQSLDDGMLDVLGGLVASGGQLVLLADPYQRDSTGTWRPQGKFKEHWLVENCRNSLPIAKLVARISGAQTPVDGAAGRVPLFAASSTGELEQLVDSMVADLRDLGPARAVVLTRTERMANRVLDALRQAGLGVGRGIRDSVIPICTIEEFRGCEAHAVVYVAERLPGSDTRTLDYLATSRACAYLLVLGLPSDWSAYDYLFEPQGD